MSKRDKKIETVKKYLKNCTSFSYYTYGNIPKEKFNNACCSYASNIAYSDAIGLIDETVWGGAKRGMLFTQDAVYSSWGPTLRYSDRYIYSRGTSGYNIEALNDLISKLTYIETSGTDTLGTILDVTTALLTKDKVGINDVYSAASKEHDLSDIISSIGDILDLFLKE